MLQSLYTATVVDHIITARADEAHRSRSLSRRRRLFSRGDRGAAPRSAPKSRLSVSGAGR
jgi:hypothetical protein